MKPSDVAKVLAAGRVVVGAALCASPGLGERWVGRDARSQGARVLTRALGIRDAALAAGVLATAGDAAALRPWLLASSACDAVDFMATLTLPPSSQRTAVLVIAAGAAVTGVALLIPRREV